jgi:gamma-glutamylputrescine oxidase
MFTSQEAFSEVAGKLDDLNKSISQVTDEKETFKVSPPFEHLSIHCKSEGLMDPGKLIQFLSEQVGARGARFLFGIGVDKVDSGELRLVGINEPIHAARILLATNGFSREIIPTLPIRPARNYVLMTKPQEHSLLNCPVHHHQGFVYFRPVGKRILLGGGRHISIDAEFTTSPEIPHLIKEWLLDFAKQHLRLNIRDAIEMEWTGTLGISPDKFPKIMEIMPKVNWIGGYSGMGVGASVHLTREWVKGI